MKKILVLFIGLILTANIWAAADLNLSLQSSGDTEITIDPSDTIYVDVFVEDIASAGLGFSNTGELTLTISGNAVFTQNTDFTYGNQFWASFGTVNHQYVNNKTLRIQAGYIAGVQSTLLNLYLDAIAIDHIGVHCTGPDDVTISLAKGGAWGNPQYWYDNTLYSDTDATTEGMTVHQTPEPVTIALLAFGGLFLHKRK